MPPAIAADDHARGKCISTVDSAPPVPRNAALLELDRYEDFPRTLEQAIFSVFLLDTLNATSELGWKAHSSLDEKEGWLEETYRSETENVNHQAYSTCNMEHADIENWLLLPRIDRHGANRLYVETKFTMRKCAEVPSARKTCKETLRLYATQVAESRRLAGRWWSDAQWDLVDTIAPNSETDAVYVQTSSLSVNSSSIYFALKDSGACTSILYVKIYHVMCPESGNSFVYLPRTLTGREAHSVVTVQGKCVVNASTSSATTPTAICKADGSWQMIGAAECDCNPGFVPTMAANSCTGK
ncbi:Eph receptor [Aphelenchoides avenae]|nr:Eph receptor [Aphelenchus avenae]